MAQYRIDDMHEFCLGVREAALESVFSGCRYDSRDYLSLAVVESVTRQICDEDLFVNQELYEWICEELADIAIGSSLSKLAAQDLIEAAWDVDDMVFWLKEPEDEE